MNADRAEKLAPEQAAAEFEGEIRELIRTRDVTFLRGNGKPAADVNNLTSLIQRVAGGSTGEIETLIAQLQDMRDYLRDEAERIQDDIAKYAKVSQAAREQVEILSDTVAQWRESTRAPATDSDRE